MSPAPGDPTVIDPAEEVYAAERRSVDRLGGLRRFRSFAEIAGYVDDLTTGDWWDENFPAAPVEIDLQRRSRHATASLAAAEAGVGLVALVDGDGWALPVVLHELAHVAAGTVHGHAAPFQRALLQLWRHEASLEAATVLAEELHRGR